MGTVASTLASSTSAPLRSSAKNLKLLHHLASEAIQFAHRQNDVAFDSNEQRFEAQRCPAEAAKLFNAVGKGGKVQAPLAKTFFASSFGMVTDKFGVLWMVMAEGSA